MALSICQPALGKSLLAPLMIIGLLVVSGCSDEPKDSTAQSSSSQSTQTTTPVDTADDSSSMDTQVIASQNTTDTDAQVAEQKTEVSEEAATTDSANADMANSVDIDKAKPEETLSANAGKELYEKTCKTCHENGLLGAPKYGDKAAWAPRIAKGKEVLYQHSINGFNAMPPRGAATDASDAQIKAAVDYMVAGSS